MLPIPSYYSDFDPDFTFTSRNVESRGDRSAKQYLEFAISDFEGDDSDRGRINAFSNAKRALHLQVETLANLFGFDASRKKNRKHISFPGYIAFIEKCGIVTPRILTKLNRVRNAVEHSYYTPSADETENFIDVVELFLAATDRAIYQFPLDIEFLPMSVLVDDIPNISLISLEPFSGKLLLNANSHEDLQYQITLTPDQSEYFLWLKVLLSGAHMNDYRIRY
ncbi:hypothetical protein H2C98_08315 [Vibrio parahaemolyticus]|uniref:hypothetical protein n=1 Tax=Vibrio parahaemolyticus TaxID=670 RepID=UPI002119EB44|nr:hypothetical protein [Vibrio parahaemolyticus]MCQ9041490.1 hypothetical protein [Vibrio parahaemolyticus]